MSPLQFQYTHLESVSCGQSVAQVLPQILQTMGAKRVMLLASATLAGRTDQFAELRQAIAPLDSHVFAAIGAHSPREDVLAGLESTREFEADVLVTLGGGSIIDAAKVIQLAVAQNIRDEAELLEYAQHGNGQRGAKAGQYDLLNLPSPVRQVAVPTTLSGAEFSNNAGVLNTSNSSKEGYRGVDLCPQHIIYDPALSLHTPDWLWLSTAIRSLDHAVEGYCSADTNAFLDGHFLHAMRLLSSALPQTFADPEDLAARSLTQQAIWLACCGLGTVAHGASHGIGYILGSLCGVPHGHTSCVMLPAVLSWNQEIAPDRHREIAAALGYSGSSGADAVRELVASLALPVSLPDLGVTREQLPEIARRAAQHPVVQKNPRRIENSDQVMEILELAWS